MIDETWYQRPPGVNTSISAGGVIVREEAGQLFVALVREENQSGYILPKGKIEQGETRDAAARREIDEEAGITDLILLAELGSRQRLSFNRKTWTHASYFLYLTRQKATTPADLHHSYFCEWFPLEHLPDMFWPEQKRLIEDQIDFIKARVEKYLAGP